MGSSSQPFFDLRSYILLPKGNLLERSNKVTMVNSKFKSDFLNLVVFNCHLLVRLAP
jgi:hypothetical protein